MNLFDTQIMVVGLVTIVLIATSCQDRDKFLQRSHAMDKEDVYLLEEKEHDGIDDTFATSDVVVIPFNEKKDTIRTLTFHADNEYSTYQDTTE